MRVRTLDSDSFLNLVVMGGVYVKNPGGLIYGLVGR